MAATDPHNNTGVMIAKLFFDMSHLPLFAPEACRNSVPPLTLPKSSGALHMTSMPTPGFGRCDRNHQKVESDCSNDLRGGAAFARRVARFPTTPLPTAGINVVRGCRTGVGPTQTIRSHLSWRFFETDEDVSRTASANKDMNAKHDRQEKSCTDMNAA
jgi:hypothetical protein